MIEKVEHISQKFIQTPISCMMYCMETATMSKFTLSFCIKMVKSFFQLTFGPSIDDCITSSWLKDPMLSAICFMRFSAFSMKRNFES